MNSDLTKEEKIKALEYVNENPEEFNIWFIGFIKADGKIWKHNDYVYEFYKKINRLNNIDIILGEDEEEDKE
jgi:hypothetical protein